MRRMHAIIPLVTLTLSLLAGALSAPSAVARELAPPGEQDALPFIPDALDCTIAPRDLDHVLDLWFPEEIDTSMTHATTRGELYAAFLPVGLPADGVTIAAITETLHGYFSCLAAGDMPRCLAYFSDDMVRAIGASPFRSREEVMERVAAGPVPAVDPVRIIAITNVMVLQDGRIGAFVVDAGPAGTFTSYVVLEQQADGRWLVDEVHQFQ